LPQSASVLAGEDAYFECQAAGDPVPRITWFRGDTIVGTGRTLKLEQVAPADQGVYVCEAESIVGMMKANATLSVFGTYFHHRLYQIFILYLLTHIWEKNSNTKKIWNNH